MLKMITDTNIAPCGKGFPLSVTERIVNEAFDLYMPQVRSEITDLANFIQKQIFDKWYNDPFYQYNILEIGTKFGGTFYIWNKLNEITNGKNISVDLPNGIHGGIVLNDVEKRNLFFQERFKNSYFVIGNSHEKQTNNQVFNILNGDRIDFLFIDGDHTYAGIKNDFFDYVKLCKPKSYVAFHDIIISDHHHSRDVYVGEFWNEIKNDYIHWEFVETENDWAGIGLLQLP